MAFVLAPYNNAMRLGQGFNTYTQQICIDDAVVVDSSRAENVLTNDGTTMRIMVQSMGRPSAWSRQKEVVVDEVPKLDETEEDSPTKETIPDKKKKLLKSKDDTESSSKSASSDTELPEDTKKPANQASASTQETETKSDNEGLAAKKAGKKALPAAGDESKSAVKAGKSDEEDDTWADVEQPEAEGKAQPAAGSGKSLKSKVTQAEAESKPEVSAEKGSVKIPARSAAGVSSDSQPVNKAIVTGPRKRASSVGKMTKADPEEERRMIEEERERVRLEKEERKEREREQREDEKERKKRERELRAELEKERWEEEKQLRAEEAKQRKEDAAHKREMDLQRRAEQEKNVADAANLRADNEEATKAVKAQMDNAFKDRFKGMLASEGKFDFDSSSIGGPSQIVTYTSRFVDKLSDITDDMNISGSLSIKAGKFGGSGRGSFIDSDKFKQSDLNFYISVKVINQTINFKDALVYNPVRSVTGENFNAVFGDGFISGFQEGGEFNALVSMKILNKAKATDIRAQAKVAFTAGPVDITAEANVNVAKTNIETNTETTIQVSWSGGGHIKPREQQWDVQSLMQAAARFPDLVAQCPQRIYAIITKYESLRSFVQTKPESYTKLQYENAQIYTNAMMDAYMSYKSLYTNLGSNIFDVQNNTKQITPWGEGVDVMDDAIVLADKESNKTASKTVTTSAHSRAKFPASLSGLADAKKAIRRQMALIVNEVDNIEKNPIEASKEEHVEPFQDPTAFGERLPEVKVPRPPKNSMPLNGERIVAKTQGEEDAVAVQTSESCDSLIAEGVTLSSEEETLLEKCTSERPSISKNLKITEPLGSTATGDAFNNIEFLLPHWKIRKLSVEMRRGAVASISVYYDNGLILSRGATQGARGRVIELTDFHTLERVISGTIQVGIADDGGIEKKQAPEEKDDDDKKAEQPKKAEHQVIGIQLFTNRGRNLVAQAEECTFESGKGHRRDQQLFTDVKTKFFDVPMKNGNIKGLFGRADEKGIWRLGFIWGDMGHDFAHDGFIDNDTASQTDPITKAWTEIGRQKARLESVTNERNTFRTDRENLNSKLGEQQKTNDDLRRERDNIRNERDRYWNEKEDLIRKKCPNARWSHDGIEVFYITWGGEFVDDDRVGNEMMERMRNNQGFQANDQTMGGDKWYGHDKCGTIIYRYNGVGNIHATNVRRDTGARFVEYRRP